MFIKKFAFAILFLICCTTSSQAKIQFTFAPEFGLMGGTTEYDMDIEGNLDSYGSFQVPGIWHLRSLLEFPLNTTIGGLTAEIRSVEDPNKWTVELKYLKNINNPSDKMLDSDWQGYSSLFPYTHFSYTESDAEMDMNIIDAEFRFRISQKPNYDISIIAGGKYQKIYQNIIGYEGWQRHLNNDTTNYNAPIFDTLQNTIAVTYEIITKQFKIGLQSDIYLSNNFTSQIKLAFAPASFNDTDDHVLRNKLSTAKGEGNGYIGGFNLRYNFSNSRLSFIQLNSSYNNVSANGAQTQYWYADDLGTPEDDTGDKFSGLPHTIRTKQYFVSLQIGIQF